MRENKFQAGLKKELRAMFPGCIIMKNDPDDIQGIPDLTVLYKDKWATLGDAMPYMKYENWYIPNCNIAFPTEQEAWEYLENT